MKKLQRFWDKVLFTTDCWVWTSATNGKGYGKFWSDRKNVCAHRFTYELYKGKIPEGLHLDHLCRNPLCVNPEHLEAVTCRENTIRGISGIINGLRQRSKTHCKRGHEFNEINTYSRGDGRRHCRKCNAIKVKEYEDRKRERNKELVGLP